MSYPILPLGVEVSTVDFLDLPGAGYCETMVFGGPYDQECDRTYDRDDARLMHERVVARLAAGEPPFAHEFSLPERSEEFLEGILTGLGVADGNKVLVREHVERELAELRRGDS